MDVATGLRIAWDVRTAKHHEHEFAIPLVRRVKTRGFDVQTVTMDKGYDTEHINGWCNELGLAPIITLRETGGVKAGKAEPPNCAHGEWTFAGADSRRQATKRRCPTGECGAKSMWVKADRLHPLVPRESKRYRQLYRQRGSVEARFGSLKHEWSLLPLRVRRLGRVQLHTDLTILSLLTTPREHSRRAAARCQIASEVNSRPPPDLRKGALSLCAPPP